MIKRSQISSGSSIRCYSSAFRILLPERVWIESLLAVSVQPSFGADALFLALPCA